ncbi:MAG: ROK family protein [Acidimicrobiales bacterium]|nr:ROK family protein [Acidimicrobiales bacterium]
MRTPEIALAIDIGGTKLACALITSDGQILDKRQVPTEQSAPAELLFDSLLDLVQTVTAPKPKVNVCGVGCGGPMSLNGSLVSPLNIPAWRQFPLLTRLQATLEVPVAIDNDAKALALGEAWFGAGRSFKNFMAMVVSTGVGGGLFVDGELLDGGNGNAGHIGHVIVEPDGAECACGARGCLEAEASGPAIARRIGATPAEADRKEKARAGMMVGRAVASAVNLLDLEQVLVGGSVALGFGDVFLDAANQELSERCKLEFSRGVKIAGVELGEAAPLVGAAAVGFRSVGIDPRAG